MYLTGTSYNHISYFLNGYLHIAGFRNFPDYSTHEFQFYPIYLHPIARVAFLSGVRFVTGL